MEVLLKFFTSHTGWLVYVLLFAILFLSGLGLPVPEDAVLLSGGFLIYFGYTACPDICPTGLQTMGRALDLVGAKAERVQPVFVSIDPDRDRPEILKRYVANFHPRLIGLTGTSSQVRAVAGVYRIQRGKVALPDTQKDGYLVIHTPTTFLMGPDGKFVTLFPYTTQPDVMARVLRRYLF